MSAAAFSTRFGNGAATARVRLAWWLAPLALFAVALALRVAAGALVRFPMTEGSAYYVAVARNLAQGRGLVVDAMWSYATPPLTLPRPAFELWQPLASLIAALPMPLLGTGYGTAQVAFALLGAALAPLAWYIARDFAARLELPPARAKMVALGAGLLAAVTGPLVLSAAIPDSTLPFTVAAVGACAVVPSALAGGRRAIIGLGVLLGLAYLTRMEAVYLGLAFVVLGRAARITWRDLLARGAASAVVGAFIAAPWWLRNVSVFGTPLPGQVLDNVFLTRNEQIFAWHDQPTLDGFLGQGAATLVSNILEAFRHDLVDVLFVPAAVVAVAGVAVLVLGRRERSALRGTALGALLIYGGIALVVTSSIFPVATLWGTFEHAAGPLIVALAVLAAAGGDAVVARVRQWRSWPRANAWLAPAALVALALPLTLFQVTGAAMQARAEQIRFEAIAQTVPSALAGAGVAAAAPLVTDRPVWLSDALHVPTLALPDEAPSDVLDLARTFGAQAIVIVEERGPYPAALEGDTCFVQAGPSPAHVFVIAEACR